jgi:ABC-type Na+ efflux pump permease subunit
MNMRRVRAIYRKEMREFRRNKQVISTMAVTPIGFLIFPTIFLFSVTPSDVSVLYSYPVQLFSLAMAAVVPAVVGAYSITGERDQGTLEPVLGTPIRTEELMLGKALAVFVPAALLSYLIFGLIDGLVWLIKPAVVSSVALRPSILLAQLIFTPLLVCMAVWGSMAISARTRDVRVAQQLTVLVNLPVVAVLILMAVHVIPFTASVTIALASKTFNRERLVLGTR